MACLFVFSLSSGGWIAATDTHFFSCGCFLQVVFPRGEQKHKLVASSTNAECKEVVLRYTVMLHSNTYVIRALLVLVSAVIMPILGVYSLLLQCLGVKNA